MRRKLPVEMIIWENLLRDGAEAARLWKDEKKEAGICDERILEPELALSTDDLLELSEFNSWGFDPADIEPLAVIAFEEVQRGHSSKAQREKSLYLIAANAEKSLLKPPLRILLEGRLRRQAWLLKKLGRERHSRLAVAAATALDKKSGIPLDKQPLLLGMVIKSLFEVSCLTGNRKDPSPG